MIIKKLLTPPANHEGVPDALARLIMWGILAVVITLIVRIWWPDEDVLYPTFLSLMGFFVLIDPLLRPLAFWLSLAWGIVVGFVLMIGWLIEMGNT